MEKDIYELTNSQKSIWLIEKFYNGTTVNSLCGAALIHEKIDANLLKKALQIICSKYDILNTKFIIKNHSIKQTFFKYSKYNIEIVHLKNEQELNEFLENEVQHPLDIENNIIYKMYAIEFDNGQGAFVYNVHHLIADAWGLSILCNETVKIYSMLKNKQPIELESAYSYQQHILDEKNYISSESFEKDKLFWQENFKESMENVNLQVSNNPKNDSSIAKRSVFSLNSALKSSIMGFCAQNQISPFAFFMSVYSIYISGVSNLDEFVIGTPILNRTNFKEKLTPGLFINVMPLKISLKNIDSFVSLTQNISLNTKHLMRHQKYSYPNILEDLRKNDKSIPNLYNIMLSYQITNNQKSETDLKYSSIWTFNGHCSDDLDIQIFNLDNSNELNISYDYRTCIFSEKNISDIHQRILYIIKQVLNNNSLKLNDIEIVTPAERKMIIQDFNKTKLNYNKSKKVIRLFEEQAYLHPNKIAIVCNNEKITYKHLNEQANILARNMIKKGLKPNHIVGIMMNRSVEMIISLIAILKCGCAYLPIDPEYPEERISYMIENSKAKFVLVNHSTKNRNLSNCKKINVDKLENLGKKNIPLAINEESLAYLIYTSGSTGKPKGVKVTNRNLNNFIVGIKDIINFDENKVMVSVTTICFDIFGLEMWVSLTSGLTLVVANEQEQNMPVLLNKLCLENNVNMIQTTPSRFSNILDDKKSLNFLENITDILIGGEPVTAKILTKLLASSNAKIYDVYGPTETTIWSTVKELTDENNITVGKPIANTQCYILNKKQQLLPINTIGELYIGGDGVSDGYYKRDDLTKEKFISSPFIKNRKIYNTNDLAYWNEDSEIVHMGRDDSQVKLHGYRIELSEIQNVIEKYPDIQKSVVLVDNEKKVLSCYYISTSKIEINKLNEHLLKYLPNYMVPSYFKQMDEFPLTPNGKVDKKKLAETKKTISVEHATTPTEKLLVSVLSEIVHIDNIDINSPFLSYGLDSLGLMQFQTMLLKYNLNLTTQSFYIYQTVKLLADYIDSNKTYYAESDIKIPAKFKHKDNNINVVNNDIANNALGNVFLTGASGFLGIHILNEILTSTNSKVYCLVRGKTTDESIRKMENCYKFYFKSSLMEYINKRIFVFNGDLLEVQFGLSASRIMKIISDTQTFIHTAAIVKHYGDFEQFKISNIDATQKIVELAFQHNKRFIHISSISVSGNYLVKQNNQNVTFSENDLYIGQNYTSNVYVNSKLNAEKIIYNYMQKGLNAEVLRIGILSGRYSDGVFQKNINENAFYGRIKSIIDLKNISKNTLSQKIEFTPVDLCAKAIVLLAKNSSVENRVYHLYNHNVIKVKNILDVFAKYGSPVNILTEKQFKKYIIDLSTNTNDQNQAIFRGIVNDLSLDSSTSVLNYNFTVDIKSDYTQQTLKELGFEWKKIDNQYLEKIVKYMKDVKFI